MSASPDPAQETVVMKFGGSSVADPDKIKDVARRLVEARERGVRVVATVSATGDTTDGLLSLAHEVSPEPHPRELDMLLSTGERIACALVAMAVHDLGYEAVSFTGSQAGIITDPVHTKAKIREITPVRVVEALELGKIVLVAGYQGFSRDTMDVTTLGRGGTDLTAVALAAALGASCEVYSDVAGVFTADPRIVPDARKLDKVSYEEMLEMAASGAKVLMLRAVELARGQGVRVHARSTFSSEPGTWIKDADNLEQPIVSAVTYSQDEVVFALRNVPDRPGSAAAIFDAVRPSTRTSTRSCRTSPTAPRSSPSRSRRTTCRRRVELSSARSRRSGRSRSRRWPISGRSPWWEPACGHILASRRACSAHSPTRRSTYASSRPPRSRSRA